MTASHPSPLRSARAWRALLALLLTTLVTPGALAHGGVSLEDDLCVLRLGSYRMHFTGYQPRVSGAEEFCEDIPVVGTAVVVLDAVDGALRDMPIELRLLRDTRDLGNDARVEELGDAAAIEAATLAHLPAAVHPTGSLTLEHAFAEPGRYIGLVRAAPASGEPVVALFPFAVGSGGGTAWFYLAVVGGAVVLALGLYAFSNQPRQGAA